jgi:hypothetical protein
LDPFGTSPVQPHPSLVFIDIVLYNAVAAQNFEYKIPSIVDKPPYLLFQPLIDRLTFN